MDSTKLPFGKYIFEWGGLMENAGGMTRAMLKRANVFMGEGVRPVILLSARGLDQYDRVKSYQQNGYPLIHESDFLCMEDYFGNRLMDSSHMHKIGYINELNELPYEEIDNCIEYYKDGEVFAKKEIVSDRFIKVKIFDETGQYIYTDHYWNDKLCRRIYKDEKNQRTEKYYAKNGFCFLVMQNYYENEKWVVKKVTLLDEKNKSIKKFESLDIFRQFFFSEYVKDCNESEIFVFCDPFLDFNTGFRYMKMSDKNVYGIGINHGVGLGDDRKWYSKANPRIENAIVNVFPPDIDAFVLLTKEAMNDFKKKFGNCDFLYSVPNTIEIPKEIGKFEDRDLNKIVYVGRFSENQKQISHIIKAFAIAAEKNDKIHLHLYGRGEDEQLYLKLINKLNLKNRVFIEGFTNSVGEVYQTAGFTVFASDFEGFSLSLLEGMANGCVPISYDFCYGPQDAIIDGINGVIVPHNNIDALADKMVYLSGNPDLLRRMSEEAYKSVQQYKEENYLINWIKVLNSVVERYPYKNAIKDMEIIVNKIIILPGINKREIEVTASVEGFIPDIAKNNFTFLVRLYNEQKTDFIIKECSAKEITDQKYEVKIDIPNQLEGEVSFCLEWNNSFLEKKLSL